VPSKPTKKEIKQNALAEAYMTNGCNQSAAYREVYDTSKMTPKSVWELASAAFSDQKVISRVLELQEQASEATQVTIETITKELEESYKMAKANDQAVAMTGSSVAKGKLHGLFIEKTKVTLDATGDFLKAIQPTTGLPSDRDE